MPALHLNPARGNEEAALEADIEGAALKPGLNNALPACYSPQSCPNFSGFRVHMWHPVKSEDCESQLWLMVAKKAAGCPWWEERREDLHEGRRVQLQKPETGCIAAFLQF